LQVLNNSEKLHEKDEGMLKAEDLGQIKWMQTQTKPKQINKRKRKKQKLSKSQSRVWHMTQP